MITFWVYYYIFEYDCWIYKLDVLPLVAAVLQALQYLALASEWQRRQWK